MARATMATLMFLAIAIALSILFIFVPGIHF
jgi:hypothetical protein